MVDFLKGAIHPSSTTFALALVAPGVALLFVPSLVRWGRRWLAAVVMLYWVLSCPASAGLLARTLSGGYRQIASADEARGAQAVVVLGGGSLNLRASGRQLSSLTDDAGLRVLEAARVFGLLKGPVVIASGGVTEPDEAAAPESAALQQALISLGVPAARILLESQGQNTRDEVLIVERMLAERGLTGFVLVTSPMHMRRAVLAFEQRGLHPIPSPSQLMPDESSPDRAFLPSEMWLRVGDSAVHEWLARGYYWWQGWLP